MEEIKISWQTLMRIIILILVCLGVWFFKDILLAVLAALILSASLEGPIRFFEAHKINRGLAVGMTYFTVLASIGLILFLFIPLLFNNMVNLISEFPELATSEVVNMLSQYGELNYYLTQGGLFKTIASVYKNVAVVFSSIGTATLVFLFAFYFSIQKGWFKKFLSFMLENNKYKNYVIDLWSRSENKMRVWLYSQLIISFFVGALMGLGLFLTGSKYVLIGALLMGALEFIPYLGPIFATFSICLLHVSQGWVSVLLVFGIAILVQYIENLVSPVIRSKLFKMDPVVIIFGIAMFGKIAGILGVIISIPVMYMIMEFVRDVKKKKISFK